MVVHGGAANASLAKLKGVEEDETVSAVSGYTRRVNSYDEWAGLGSYLDDILTRRLKSIDFFHEKQLARANETSASRTLRWRWTPRWARGDKPLWVHLRSVCSVSDNCEEACLRGDVRPKSDP